jgi:hypothetical protein
VGSKLLQEIFQEKNNLESSPVDLHFFSNLMKSNLVLEARGAQQGLQRRDLQLMSPTLLYSKTGLCSKNFKTYLVPSLWHLLWIWIEYLPYFYLSTWPIHIYQTCDTAALKNPEASNKCPTNFHRVLHTPYTASINWSNMPVQCSNCNVQPVIIGLVRSNQSSSKLVGQVGPITGHKWRFKRCSNGCVQPVNAGTLPALTGWTGRVKHWSNMAD